MKYALTITALLVFLGLAAAVMESRHSGDALAQQSTEKWREMSSKLPAPLTGR